MTRSLVLALALAASIAACQERLASPANCPDLCPGNFDVRDTILTPVLGSDTSHQGYVQAGQGSSLRVSWQFPASEDRAVLRFIPRSDSFQVNDTLYPYSIDSVSLAVSLLVRDTTVKGLTLFLYRMPATVDSTVGFTDIDTAFTAQNLVDSIVVDDSIVSQRFVRVLSGADLAKVVIPAVDSGVLALGVQIRATSGTGVRIGGSAGGIAAPTFVSYVQVDTGDTTLARTLTRSANFSLFVPQVVPALDPDLLTLGGVPSARTLLRFPWPAYLRDSAQLIRVTLELLPAAPAAGLYGDTAYIQVRPVLADLGSKSPASTDGLFVSVEPIVAAAADTLRVEVRRAVSLWQGADPLPSAFLLQLLPEGSSFSRATFGSSRSPGLVPRLRVTYARKFPFEAP
jgi:hypothetical protein